MSKKNKITSDIEISSKNCSVNSGASTVDSPKGETVKLTQKNDKNKKPKIKSEKTAKQPCLPDTTAIQANNLL